MLAESCSNGLDGDYLSIAGAAGLLGLSRRQVQRFAAADAGLPGVRCGSIWLLRRDAVLALAREPMARR